MSSIIDKIEGLLKSKIIRHRATGGGCIASTEIIHTERGQNFFLKHGFSNGMFLKEANGLNELRKAGCIRVPKGYCSR